MDAIEKKYLLMACFLLIVPLKSYWCITSVIDDEVANLYCPVSMTPVMHDATGVNDTGKECIASVIDTSDVRHHRYL